MILRRISGNKAVVIAALLVTVGFGLIVIDTAIHKYHCSQIIRCFRDADRIAVTYLVPEEEPADPSLVRLIEQTYEITDSKELAQTARQMEELVVDDFGTGFLWLDTGGTVSSWGVPLKLKVESEGKVSSRTFQMNVYGLVSEVGNPYEMYTLPSGALYKLLGDDNR